MPMIDVYASEGTFPHPHDLARDLAAAVMRWELAPTGVLDREKQVGVVKELTEIVASASGDPSAARRTWVLITESPEGGWGIAGHANTGADIAEAARRALCGQ